MFHFRSMNLHHLHHHIQDLGTILQYITLGLCMCKCQEQYMFHCQSYKHLDQKIKFQSILRSRIVNLYNLPNMNSYLVMSSYHDLSTLLGHCYLVHRITKVHTENLHSWQNNYKYLVMNIYRDQSILKYRYYWFHSK